MKNAGPRALSDTLSSFAALRDLRDLYVELNRIDPWLYDPQCCADALDAACRLAPSELPDELAKLESRLRGLRAASAR